MKRTLECLMTARHYGVENSIIKSLGETFPGIDWDQRCGYAIGRAPHHGRRRAAEIREAAGMLGETGLPAAMSDASARTMDWLVDVVQAMPDIRKASDADWRSTLNRLCRVLAHKD